MHFFPVPHTLLPLKFQGHGGTPAHLTRPSRPAPSGRISALRAKYLSQVAAKTPSLLKVPSAGWVAAPPWGRGREHFPGGSLHRRVERPSTKKRSGTRNTGAVQRRRQRPGPRPRVLPTHQKGTIHLVGAPQELPSRWLRPVRSVLTRNWGPHGEPPSYLTLPGGRKVGGAAVEVPVEILAAGTVNTAGGQWQGTRDRHPYWPSRDLTATHFASSGHGDNPTGRAE